MSGSRIGTQGIGTIRNEKGFGAVQLVDSAPARTHLTACLDYGMTARSIAALAGVTPRVLANILAGQPSCKEYVANAILDVTIGLADETHNNKGQNSAPLVPKLGAVRRLQALAALGWPRSEISRRLGADTESIHRRHTRINRATHDRIAALYDELCMTPGPSARARTWAAKRGYAPPLAWDRIDDPNETPKFGEDHKRDTLAEYRFLIEAGESHHAAITKLGITNRGLERAIYREKEAA